jgi:hypothetical protein
MTVNIPNPKFRDEYALNDLQGQIDAIVGQSGDLTALADRVTAVEGVASDAKSTADTALADAGSAKAKTDKLTVNASSVGFLNVNGSNDTPGLRIALPGYNRFLYWNDNSLSLWNSDDNSRQWGIRADLMKYSSFTAKTDVRVLYLNGSLIINLSGTTVTFDGKGNWIRVATLDELHITKFIGLTPVYAACNRGYEDGYEVTLKLQSDGLFARSGSASGAYPVYGQLVAFAWALPGAKPMALPRKSEPARVRNAEPAADDGGLPVPDDGLEFAVMGG